MEQKKYKSTYYTMCAFLIVALLLVVGVSLSYAYIESDSQNKYTDYSINSNVSCVSLNYSESGIINLDKQIPLKDEQSSQISPVTITVTNNCPNQVRYSLFITSLVTNGGANYIEDSKIKIKVDGSATIAAKALNSLSVKASGTSYTQINNSLASRSSVNSYTPRTSYYITSNTTPTTINASETHTYTVRLWIDYYEGNVNNSTQGKSFAAAFTLVSPGVDY